MTAMTVRQTWEAFAVQSVAVVFCALVSFLLLAWLGRVLGPLYFGEYVLILNAAVIGLMVLEGGWSVLVYRQTTDAGPEGSGQQGMSAALCHVLLFTALAVAVFSAAALLGWPRGVSAVAAALCMGMVAVISLVSARMRGAGSFASEALWQSVARLASAAGIVLMMLWLPPSQLWGIFAGWAVALALVAAWLGRRWLVRPSARQRRQLAPRALPLLLLAVASAFLLRADVLLLAMLGAAADQLSAYAVATRFLELALLLLAPVLNVLLRAFRQASRGEGLRLATLRWVAMAWLIGATGSLLCWLMAVPLVLTVFGPGHAAAADLLPVLMLALPFCFANLVFAQAWVAVDGEKMLLRLTVAAGVLLALLMAPGWQLAGPIGAASGMVLTQLLLFVGILTLWLSRTR